MNRFLLFFCLLLISFSFAKAEVGVVAGARAGINFSHLRKFQSPSVYKNRVNLGSDIAGTLRIDFNNYIGIQTEIEFTQKGQSWKSSFDSAKYAEKYVVNYVQFPILAVARVGSEKIKGIFQLGPYVSYWSGGYTQNSVSIDKQSKNATTTKKVFTSDDRRVDAGIIVGAGVNILKGKNGVELGLRYNAGFIDMDKTPTKSYTSTFNFYVGYTYTIKAIE